MRVASTSSSATVVGRSGGPGRNVEAHQLPSHEGKPPCRLAESLSSGRNSFAGLNGFVGVASAVLAVEEGGIYE